MRIIILGAGQVGASVAENLVSEENDITLIDMDKNLLGALQDRLDIRTVVGNAAYPTTLRDAGAEDAEVLIAATQSDQTNLVACKVAQSVFHIPTRIARLRSADFLEDDKLLGPDNFAVDYAICPEQDITDYIVKLVEYPEALQVLEFGNGRLSLVGVRAFEGGPLIGRPLCEVQIHLPNVDFRVAAIFRGDEAIIPEGSTVIAPGDEIFLLAATENIRYALEELRRMDRPVKRVMIAGCGNIGMRLARRLEKDYQVKVIEGAKVRADFVAQQLNKALVLVGDATDGDLLEEENIDEMDLFLALTNDDEDNIMAATLAKRLGCRRVLALINRKAYAEMVQGGPIDIAMSPAQIAISCVLAHFRRGDVARVHSLRRGLAEALEIVAHGDAMTSKVVGRRIDQIDLPRGATIAAIVRDLDSREVIGMQDVAIKMALGHVEMAHHDTLIEPDDHVIVFCTSKKLVPKVERLFQVSIGFI
ncbi:MAG: Trk system potassium transporter TrkA [Sterolibacteriaceae bacterium]|uniref:Trk system potassium uptake protein TrkA n=1 Tax=Candidatus Methylophosphatis roskildensis TaxID=2899263 RepID=A0A9D7HRU6_9PROT|nr:Trk system potassium transporter TrkA [Candidatus Methylophosphatis roskildensis]